MRNNPRLYIGKLNNKGIFFSIDAILAATLILMVIMVSSSFYVAKKTEKSMQLYSSDLLKVLKELKIQEVEDDEVVKALINQSYITNKNNSILDQIGELWSEGNFGQARNLTKEFSQDFI